MEKLDKKVKEFLITVLKEKGKFTDDIDKLTGEFIDLFYCDSKNVYNTIVGQHRWYDDELNVVEIGGRYIGYLDYYMTGDACASDMDLDFDWSAVQFYEPHTVTKTEYRPV